MKISKFIVGNLIFLGVLGIVYLTHIKYFSVGVVFYSAIVDGVIASIITFLIIYLSKYFSIYSVFEKLQMGVIFILIGYIFAISVPTVLDRSLSFYLLEKIQQRGGGIKHSAFEDVFTKEYMLEHRLVDVRLTEQLESGTIEIIDGCVKLTQKGNSLASFSRYFRQNFLPKQRLLMGEYSDDLTDPFSHGAVDSTKNFTYICK